MSRVSKILDWPIVQERRLLGHKKLKRRLASPLAMSALSQVNGRNLSGKPMTKGMVLGGHKRSILRPEPKASSEGRQGPPEA